MILNIVSDRKTLTLGLQTLIHSFFKSCYSFTIRKTPLICISFLIHLYNQILSTSVNLGTTLGFYKIMLTLIMLLLPHVTVRM